ncbi:GNAT family N-acetyltransferase [Paenibacillus alkalitolerans]|uniref:GNAT family N-acetyltransferase n=1 Tax=Paenibacillus alkalitolerans TaxID=2799335 RepID=UPI0018F3CEF8|nr:GNAT family N-acetyltransferase [Paenibacillus alkalitolerans]
MANLHRESTLSTVRKLLSANLSCLENDFSRTGTFVYEAEKREGGFRFPFREKSLSVVTMGKGVIISCNSERMAWVKEQLGQLHRGQIFSAAAIGRMQQYVSKDHQYIAGPDQKYVCSSYDTKPFELPEGLNVTLVQRNEVPSLYAYNGFNHALSYRVDNPRPDVLATVAEFNGEIVGIAGASEDSELMWQIGVNILDEYQGRGIGKALVGTLTNAILNEGAVPYYSTEVSNLQSRQLAISLGYWPAWVELYARE